MLQAMKRIQVIGPKTELGTVVDLLYEAGTLHIENAPEQIPKDEISLTGVRQEEADEIAGVLSAITAIFATLPALDDDVKVQTRIRANLEKKTTRSSSPGPGRLSVHWKRPPGGLRQRRPSSLSRSRPWTGTKRSSISSNRWKRSYRLSKASK